MTASYQVSITPTATPTPGNIAITLKHNVVLLSFTYIKFIAVSCVLRLESNIKNGKELLNFSISKERLWEYVKTDLLVFQLHSCDPFFPPVSYLYCIHFM